MKNGSNIIFLLMCVYFLNLGNSFSQNTVMIQSTESEFKKWQIKIGHSLNNKNIYNLEGSYLISLSNAFAVSFDTRVYNFLTISPSLTTQPIPLSEKLLFSAKAGIGFVFFGPVAGLTDIAFEFGASLRYEINKNYRIILEYKQISKNSAYVSFETLPPKQIVKNFPIRFISIGIEF